MNDQLVLLRRLLKTVRYPQKTLKNLREVIMVAESPPYI